MSEPNANPEDQRLSLPALAPPKPWRRAVHMMLVWMLLGVAVGIGAAPANAGMVRMISGAIAGMIVMSVVGAIVGLVGGKVWESFVGALCGVLTGVIAGVISGQPNIGFKANVGLIVGAIAGATLPAIFARFKRQDVKQTAIHGPTLPLPRPLSGQTPSQDAPLPDRHQRLAG